jgi:zinc finger protein
MTMNQTEYVVDHFGSVLMAVSVCQECGYKHTDVLTLEKREPVAITARIRTIEDLNIHVIKSGTATISIPEFGATIIPGPYSEGYISNVEGVLERVEDALTFMLTSAKGKKLKKGQRLLKQMRMAREEKPRFALEIKDPLGNSAVASPDPTKIRKRKLSKTRTSDNQVRSICITKGKTESTMIL